MFQKNPPPKYEKLIETELEHKLVTLQGLTTEEYSKQLAHVEKLHALVTSKTSSSVSKETWATIGANLLGILLIIHHEHANVITSKALGIFVTRLR